MRRIAFVLVPLLAFAAVWLWPKGDALLRQPASPAAPEQASAASRPLDGPREVVGASGAPVQDAVAAAPEEVTREAVQPETSTRGTRLVIEVVVPDADPKESTYVSLLMPNGYPYRKRLSAARRIEFDVEPDRELVLTVEASPAGRAHFEHHEPALQSGERRNLRLEVPPVERVECFVRVTDDRGLAVQGAQVRFGPIEELLWTSAPAKDFPRARSVPAARTDVDGYASVEVPLLFDLAVRVDAEGLVTELVAVDDMHGTRTLAHELRLERAASLAIVLGDVEREGTTVEASAYTICSGRQGGSAGRERLPDLRWVVAPDEDGMARISGLPSQRSIELGVRTVEPSRLTDPPEVVLAAGERRELDLRRGSLARVLGSMRDTEGVPVSNAEVWLRPARDDLVRSFQDWERVGARVERTDAAGRFRFDDVTDGAWWVGPGAGGDLVGERVALLVAGGRGDDALDLVVERGFHILGRAVSSSGSPVESGWVSASRGDSWEMIRASLARDGTFSLGPLRAGSYDVVAWPSVDNEESLGRSERVEVAAGTTDLTLVCPASGRLITELDEEASVTYWISHTLPNGLRRLARAPIQASAELTHHHVLDTGRYDVFASTEEGRYALARGVAVESGAPATRVRLELRPVGRLRVHFDAEDMRAEVTVLHGDAIVGGGSGEGAATLEFSVPPGRSSVELRSYSKGWPGPLRRVVDVPEGGEPVVVDFRS